MAHWTELVIKGREEAVRAFVGGVVAGRGGTEHADVVHARDVDLEPASLGERLHELLRASSHVVVFAGPALAPALVAGLAAQGPALGLGLEGPGAVVGARMGVRAVLFSREGAAQVRALLDDVSRGMRTPSRAENEELHAEGKGVELYAPLHEYTYRVTAELGGPVGEVIAAAS